MPDLSHIQKPPLVPHTSLFSISEHGWRTGLLPLLRYEQIRWWRTWLWLWQSLIWLFTINGIVALNLRTTGGHTYSDVLARGVNALVGSMNIFAVVGAILLAQSAVIGEKQAKTTLWLLSKPVSRSALLLAKLLSQAIGITLTLIVLQGMLAYLLFWLFLGYALPLTPFLSALTLITLNLWFYLCLTLLISTLSSSRGPVVGIPILFLLFQEIVRDYIGPFLLGLPVVFQNVEESLLENKPLSPILLISVIFVIAWSVLCLLLAIRQFQHEDF